MFKIDPKMILKVDTYKKDRIYVLSLLSKVLTDANYVKNTYADGILKREENYPTGLFTGHINVAVPHTDCIHVNEDAIAVGILSDPVIFRAMDDVTKSVPVSIIIMLALKEAHGQVAMLQKIIALVKEQQILKNILEIDNSQKVYKILSNYLK